MGFHSDFFCFVLHHIWKYMEIPTAEAIINVNNHFEKYPCNVLYGFALTQPKLLNAANQFITKIPRHNRL